MPRCRGRIALVASAIAVIAGLHWTVPSTASLPKDRTIAFTNIHTKETISVQYVKAGKHVPEALEKIDWILRDWRKDESTKMDRALIDLIWEVHAELGSNEPVHIISGYRSRATNDMLRKTVGGQASESRHILGKAADVYFPDVPLKRLRYSALIRERGGVGYYPTSATPFVHLDTDRVRSWPRLPRFELALLFPGGRTQHAPADGGPITPEDVKTAQARHKDVAQQVAEFQGSRRDISKVRTLIATATPPSRPDIGSHPAAHMAQAGQPARPASHPSQEDRTKLAQMFALASAAGLPEPRLTRSPEPAMRPRPSATLASLSGPPQVSLGQGRAAVPERPEARVAAIAPMPEAGTLNDAAALPPGFSTGWVPAPAFDEEHPEELSYRPFPIAPYLTETDSADDPALAVLTHPDVARTLDMLDQAGSAPPMHLRPGQQLARVMWAQQFSGAAVPRMTIEALLADDAGERRTGIADRRVQTGRGN